MKNKVLFLLAPFILSFAPFASADITLTAGDFVQNTDGTVTHTPTGLVWQAPAQVQQKLTTILMQ
jgi:hypothetical protein